jgi:hypothetical protein
MRREIEGKRFSGIAVMCTAILFFFVVRCSLGTSDAIAQTLPSTKAGASAALLSQQEAIERISARLAEQMSDEGGGESVEETLDYYYTLAQRPLDINAASESTLRRLGLLSEFQVRSLLDYIAEFGAILSESELELISGFNADLVALIRPFISFGPADGHLQGDGPRQDAMLRVDRKFGPAEASAKGLPVTLTAKYRVQCNLPQNSKLPFKEWEAGVSARQTAFDTLRGGFLPSFTSAHAALRDIPLFRPAPSAAPALMQQPQAGAASYSRRAMLEKLVVGDFTARFGQGLTMWKAFAVTFVSQPSSLCKAESGIEPYASASGTNFLRGVGATITWRNWSFSAFASDVGPHTVVGYAPKKGSRRLAGMNVSRTFKRFKVGATVSLGGIDTLNAGMDFYISPGRGWRIFGEAAASLSPYILRNTSSISSASSPSTSAANGNRFAFAPAALLGCVWSPTYEFEAAAMLRSYSAAFVAPDAGAYSTLTRCENQQGMTLSVKWLKGYWSTAGYIDAAYYPASRYGIKTSSAAIKSRLDASRTFKLGSRYAPNPHPDTSRILELGSRYAHMGESNQTDTSKRGKVTGKRARAELIRNLTISARASYTYKAPSEEHRAGLRIESEYTVGKHFAMTSRFEGCTYVDAIAARSAPSMTQSPKTSDCNTLTLSGGSVEFGLLAYQDIYLKYLDDRLIFRAMGVLYKTSSWNSRIYCYEYDLPQTFFIPAYYGPVKADKNSTSTSAGATSSASSPRISFFSSLGLGAACAGVISYRFRNGFTIWLKASTKLCRFGLTARL